MWAADITYIPIGRGFLYLVAVMDWASHAVLAWRLVQHDGRIVRDTYQAVTGVVLRADIAAGKSARALGRVAAEKR